MLIVLLFVATKSLVPSFEIVMSAGSSDIGRILITERDATSTTATA